MAWVQTHTMNTYTTFHASNTFVSIYFDIDMTAATNAFDSFSLQLNLVSFFSNRLKGSVRLGRSGINLPTQVTSPKKLRVSSFFLGFLNDCIVLTFSGSTSMPLSDSMCPRNLTFCDFQIHFPHSERRYFPSKLLWLSRMHRHGPSHWYQKQVCHRSSSSQSCMMLRPPQVFFEKSQKQS